MSPKMWPFGGKAKQRVAVAKVGTIMKDEAASFLVAGKKIAVARTHAGYFGFDDTCTHMQCELSKGFLRSNTIVCPCHGSEFDIVTGKVVKGPAKSPIRAYEVRVTDGSIELEI